MTKSVVIITTSHDKMGDTGNATGSWAEEIMSPFWEFKGAGYKVTIASMKGGRVPLDEKSLSGDFRTEEVDKFYADSEAVKQLENSVPFSSLSASDFDAVFIPGGHGVCWDMADDAHDLQKFIAGMFESGKVVGSVCHGPLALANVKLSDGSYLCAGKAVTGFSNTEEEGVGLTKVVPYLLEDRLKEVGGKYSKGQDWNSYTQVDGRLITGQNPQSSKEVGSLMIKALS